MTPSTGLLADLLEHFGLSARPHDKPRVAVSACLIGQMVRYDGEHKHDRFISGELGAWFELHPLCPEVGIGLPVPRPPIQVVDVEGDLRVQGVDNPDTDVTEPLRRFALDMDGAIDGLILKARSPSCGVGSTPIIRNGEASGEVTDGAFAAAARERFPAIARRDEEALRDPDTCHAFILHCYLYHRWRNRQADSGTVAKWKDLCLQQGTLPFKQLADVIRHWQGVA